MNSDFLSHGFYHRIKREGSLEDSHPSKKITNISLLLIKLEIFFNNKTTFEKRKITSHPGKKNY